MQVAQHLYENGLITYMRTDSVALSPEFCAAVRQWLEQHDPDNVPTRVARHRSGKAAQEAHEAIRPTDLTRASAQLQAQLNADQISALSPDLETGRGLPVQTRSPTQNAYHHPIWPHPVASSGAGVGICRLHPLLAQSQGRYRLTCRDLRPVLNLGPGSPSAKTNPATPQIYRAQTRASDGASGHWPPLHLRPHHCHPQTAGLCTAAQGQTAATDDPRPRRGWLLGPGTARFTRSRIYGSDGNNIGCDRHGQTRLAALLDWLEPALFSARLEPSPTGPPSLNARKASQKTLPKSRTKCPQCQQCLSKVMTQKVKKGYFLKCEQGCQSEPGKALVLFWSDYDKQWQSPRPKSETGATTPTAFPCPVCGQPLEAYHYTKGGQAKALLRCSAAGGRGDRKHKDVVFFQSKGVWWSKKFGEYPLDPSSSHPPVEQCPSKPDPTQPDPTEAD